VPSRASAKALWMQQESCPLTAVAQQDLQLIIISSARVEA
jgi:hypothetical protein